MAFQARHQRLHITSVQYRQHQMHVFLCCMVTTHQSPRISSKQPSTQQSVQYRQTIRNFMQTARQICHVFRPLACCQSCHPIGRSCSPMACQTIFHCRFHIAAHTCVRYCRIRGLCHIHAAARHLQAGMCRIFVTRRGQAAMIFTHPIIVLSRVLRCVLYVPIPTYFILPYTHQAFLPDMSGNCIMAKLVIIRHSFYSPS